MTLKQKHPEAFTVKAWGANAIAFIDERGLTREFSDWCGGWPCPVTPQMIAAAPALLEALEKLMPTNMNVAHCSLPDDANIPCDIPLGDLRAALAALAVARGEQS